MMLDSDLAPNRRGLSTIFPLPERFAEDNAGRATTFSGCVSSPGFQKFVGGSKIRSWPSTRSGAQGIGLGRPNGNSAVLIQATLMSVVSRKAFSYTLA